MEFRMTLLDRDKSASNPGSGKDPGAHTAVGQLECRYLGSRTIREHISAVLSPQFAAFCQSSTVILMHSYIPEPSLLEIHISLQLQSANMHTQPLPCSTHLLTFSPVFHMDSQGPQVLPCPYESTVEQVVFCSLKHIGVCSLSLLGAASALTNSQ